jgi:hypothetical protein
MERQSVAQGEHVSKNLVSAYAAVFLYSKYHKDQGSAGLSPTIFCREIIAAKRKHIYTSGKLDSLWSR